MPLPLPPEYPCLKFNFNTYSVTFIEEEIITYNRPSVSTLQVNRSNMGHFVFSGNNYYPYSDFQLTLLLKGEEKNDLITAIYNASTKKATEPPRTGFKIFLDDIAQPIIEERVTVPSALEWVDTVGASTKYFGRFEGIITEFSSVPNGVGYDVELTFSQTEQL